MQIAAVHVRDYKRIKDVEIRPPADKVLVLIGGFNANGKTSLLDALTVAFGGKSAQAADPVRHGAEDAEIRVELTGGAGPLTVRRVIEPDGSSKLEVRDDLGAVKSPQAMLDKLVGSRFLDPLAFLALKAADQRQALLQVIDGDGKIAELDARRDRVFQRRTEVARDVKKLSAQFEAMVPVDPAAPIDVGALVGELRQLDGALHDLSNMRHARDNAKRTYDNAIELQRSAEKALADAQAKLDRAREATERCRQTFADAAGKLDQYRAADGAEIKRDEIQAKIRQAGEHNQAIAALRAKEQQRVALGVNLDGAKLEHDHLDDEIRQIDAKKAAALAGAKLPVPGLGVDVNGVILNGVPLAQASGAEKLRVALALAIAASPHLRDVWVRDGSLLDDDSLQAVADHAAAVGVRVWVERVGDRDPGAIVIHDGQVRDVKPPTAQAELFA